MKTVERGANFFTLCRPPGPSLATVAQARVPRTGLALTADRTTRAVRGRRSRQGRTCRSGKTLRHLLTTLEAAPTYSNAATVPRITNVATRAAPSNTDASPSPVICQTITAVPNSAPM